MENNLYDKIGSLKEEKAKLEVEYSHLQKDKDKEEKKLKEEITLLETKIKKGSERLSNYFAVVLIIAIVFFSSLVTGIWLGMVMG